MPEFIFGLAAGLFIGYVIWVVIPKAKKFTSR